MHIKTHSKFFNLINDKYRVLNEQVPAGQPQLPIQDPALNQPPIPQQPQVPVEPEGEPEVKQLTSEGEVELIRLIRKALVLEPDEGSIPPDILDEEINEENGREILMKMKRFISTYSEDPDINY